MSEDAHYIPPQEVTTPAAYWELHEVLYDGGAEGWSAAEGTWNGKPCVALRWNVSEAKSPRGFPNVRGLPTWFVVPDDLADIIRAAIKLKLD